MVQLSSGEILASRSGLLYKSTQGDANFESIPEPKTGHGGITKDENDRLFLFRYDGIWISLDKGITWTHECPPAYFPAFDVSESSVIPKASDIYYGMTSQNSILKYDYNKDDVNFAVRNSNIDNFKIEQFHVTSDGTIYYTFLVKASGLRSLVRRKGGQTITLAVPTNSIASTFAVGPNEHLFIHDGSSVYSSQDRGENWVDITANLPAHISVNLISTADDNTVYLGCKNGNIYKSGKSLGPTTTTEIKPANFNLYPNPSFDFITIEDKNYHSGQTKTFVMYDLNGRKIKEIFTSSFKTRVDLHGISSGVYILVYSQEGTMGRFIKVDNK